MICNKCKTENNNDNIFCTKCGYPFGADVCPACNYVVQDKKHACPKCNFILETEQYICRECQSKNDSSHEFCPNCGTKKPKKVPTYSMTIFLDTINGFYLVSILYASIYFLAISINYYVHNPFLDTNEFFKLMFMGLLGLVNVFILIKTYISDMVQLAKSKDRMTFFELRYYRPYRIYHLVNTIYMTIAILAFLFEWIYDDTIILVFTMSLVYIILFIPIQQFIRRKLYPTMFME